MSHHQPKLNHRQFQEICLVLDAMGRKILDFQTAPTAGQTELLCLLIEIQTGLEVIRGLTEAPAQMS